MSLEVRDFPGTTRDRETSYPTGTCKTGTLDRDTILVELRILGMFLPISRGWDRFTDGTGLGFEVSSLSEKTHFHKFATNLHLHRVSFKNCIRTLSSM